MGSRVSSLAVERGDDLHDCACREQASEGVGVRPDESGAVAAVDRCIQRLGPAPNEPGAVDRVCQKPSEVEQVAFEKAIWAAFCQCFLSFDEACDAIWRHKNGMLIEKLQPPSKEESK